jgi:hypothetical protein
MSTWYQARMSCSECASRFDAKLLHGAHASRAPELRSRALAGTLNELSCPSCEVRLAADVAMVYTDLERGQWIYVGRRAELPDWRAVEATALGLFETALASSPAAAALPDTHVRVVFDTGELRERLVTWDAGLGDAALECVKLHCLRERPDVREPGERIRVATIADDAVTLVAGPAPAKPRCSWKVPRAQVDAIAADPRWRAELPELFRAGFVSLDRYLV